MSRGRATYQPTAQQALVGEDWKVTMKRERERDREGRAVKLRDTRLKKQANPLELNTGAKQNTHKNSHTLTHTHTQHGSAHIIPSDTQPFPLHHRSRPFIFLPLSLSLPHSLSTATAAVNLLPSHF